jgi:hypothetical protein
MLDRNFVLTVSDVRFRPVYTFALYRMNSSQTAGNRRTIRIHRLAKNIKMARLRNQTIFLRLTHLLESSSALMILPDGSSLNLRARRLFALFDIVGIKLPSALS